MSPFQIWVRDDFHEDFREDSKVYLIESLLGLLAVAAEAGGDDGGVDHPAPGQRRGAIQIGQTVPGMDKGQQWTLLDALST